MSVNDTDEWASMIINEICLETNAFEKILKSKNTNDNEANEKSKLCEISYHEDDLSQYVSANYEDFLNSSSNKFGEEWEESISNSEISVEFKKDDILRFTKDQDIFTDVQNMTSESNLKANVELKEEIEISEVAADSIEKVQEKSVKNYDISSSEDNGILVDLDEAFIQDIEMDLENINKPGKNLEVSILNENIEESSKCFLESPNEERNNLNILNFKDRQHENEAVMNDNSVILNNMVIRNSAEQLHLCNEAVFPESFVEKNSDFDPMHDKNEFKTGNVSSISADLESVNGSSEKFLKRLDMKIKCLRFRKSPTESSRNINRNMKSSNSLSNLHCKWFEENYINEETEYSWGSDDEVVGKEFLVMNRPNITINELTSYSVGGNLNENVNKPLTRDRVRYKTDLNDNALKENFVCMRKTTSNVCTKRKFEMVLEPNAENANEIFTQNYPQWLDIKDGEKLLETYRRSEVHSIRNSNKIVPEKKNNDKSIFTCKSYKSDQEKDDSSETAEEMDNEEQEIRNRRINFVISTYRDMCSTWETIFVRPFANVFADTYELLAFVFFLSVCLLYFFYGRVLLIISNHKFSKMVKSSSNICDEKEKSMLSDSEQTAPPVTPTDVTMTDGATLSGEENVTDSSSMERNEIIKLKDINLFVKIEPKEVSIVYLDYEFVTENLENDYEKIEKFLTASCSRERHVSTVATNEDCLIDLKLSSIDEESELLLNENDFDMEILASSKRLRCDIGESLTQAEVDNSYDLSEVPEQYEENSETDLGIEINSQRSLPGISPKIPCRDEKPLLNSTEVCDQGAFPKYKSCSRFKALSASDITYSRSDSLETPSSTSMEREYLDSSLKVNVSSFSSRSEVFSDSILINSEGYHDGESMESAEDTKISDEMESEALYVPLPSRNPNAPMIESLQDVSMNDSVNNIRGSNEENFFENYFDEKSSKPNSDSPSSQGFQISSASDMECQDISEGALMCGDAKCIESLSSPNDSSDLSLKGEANAKETNADHKSKNSLRRRMSLILNNWKNLQVMPCVMKNPRNKKNCKTRDPNQE